MPDEAAATASRSSVFRLAIVGGGPRATYAVERVSAGLRHLPADVALHVTVFERTGEFGAGLAHSPTQPRTSFLNRIACQIGFAADEHTPGAVDLRPRAQRPTLLEWCRRQHALTGDPDLDLGPEDWPRRYVHGLALQAMFTTYVDELAANPRVSVDLLAEEVVGISEAEHDGKLLLRTPGGVYAADEVLLVTGHPLRAVAPSAGWVTFAYPLEERLSEDVAGPAAVVGCRGTGLTAIDVVLHLTEGRGGSFARTADGTLAYTRSGREPARIVAFSESGLFTFARPVNQKALDPARLENAGVFLTRASIDRVRAAVAAQEPTASAARRARLDFDQHVLPLIKLEMGHLHYRALFGAQAASWWQERVAPCHAAWLDGAGTSDADPLATLNDAAGHVAASVAVLVSPGEPAAPPAVAGLDVPAATMHWVGTVFGHDARTTAAGLIDEPAQLSAYVAALRSPWSLSPDPCRTRFDADALVRPIPYDAIKDAADYTRRVLAFMRRDRLWAAHGNLENPYKAASDGSWRDLRDVISYAVEHGGLTPVSQVRFDRQYVRVHNRVANGAALEVMERIEALITCGLVDIGVGPDAIVTLGTDGEYVVRGPWTGVAVDLDVLVEARLQPFDPRRDPSPLYATLIADGLVRLWRNEDGGATYSPGGLDLDEAHHPRRSDGRVASRLTVLGPATVGLRAFRMDALKPERSHYVAAEVTAWCNGMWSRLAQHSLDDLTGAAVGHV